MKFIIRVLVFLLKKLASRGRAIDYFTNKKDHLLLYRISPYLEEIGWIRSAELQSSVNNLGESIPWLTYSFLDFLSPRLNDEMVIFEFGSGNSTDFFSTKVSHVFSVEHEQEWYDKREDKSNVTLIFNSLDSDNYEKTIGSLDRSFDLVIVDGRKRVKCLSQSVKYLRNDGVIVLDDSERADYSSGVEFMISIGYKHIQFWGLAPGVNYKKCTSVFYKEHNCLKL
ncbi:MAG: hypothetical protein ACI8Q1_002127 [Parvicella sp.]|jgi:hypothetical protein